MVAHEGQLAFQRIRRSQRRRAQQVNQVLVIWTKAWTRFKIIVQRSRELRIGAGAAQLGIVKQFLKRTKCRVDVGQPEKDHLLKSDSAMRNPVSGAGKPLGR